MKLRPRYTLCRQWIVALSAAVLLPPMVTAGAADASAASPAAAVLSTAPGPVVEHGASPDPGPDRMVAGLGDASGYRVFQAGSGNRWTWTELADLSPGGATGEKWTGTQCLTGDGRTLVAVVAPWHMTNAAAGGDRGAVAYAVDTVTGHSKVLATGVSMYYFNPGCGAGSQVSLTRYLGTDQQTTQVLRIDAATGRVLETETVDAEETSAVPVDGTIVAAQGADLVRLAGNRASVLAHLPAGAMSLTPNALHGVDLLAADSTTTSAWRWTPASLIELSLPTTQPVKLLPGGAAGRTTLLGAHSTVTASLQSAASTNLLAVSTGGDAFATAPGAGRPGIAELPGIVDASGRVLRTASTAPAAGPSVRPVTSAVPVDPAGTLQHAAAPTRDAPLLRTAIDQAATAAAPGCSVPRADLRIQVPQPSNSQINWAVQQAVINSLPQRPAGFDNLPAGYSPSSDFPQPDLLGPFTAGTHVPEVLEDAILAQESNWEQASWHSPSGMAGDPLVANYYGNAGNNAYPINYAASDCGYGLGQVTDGMGAGAVTLTAAQQQRVAVDYAENIAASVQILAKTWNTLYSDGITINGADPRWLEDWYATVWAYNSGVHSADSAGNWGLGWKNNPINPIYPAKRGRFLLDAGGYSDASHPADWPYQELVFGWMNYALQRDGENAYTDVDANVHVIGLPDIDAMCSNADNCDPTDPADLYCKYQAADSLQDHCWWHQTITNPFSTPADMFETAGQSEPQASDPEPPTCSPDAAWLETGSNANRAAINTVTIVSDTAILPQNPGLTDMNVAGCPANPSARGWAQGGTFDISNAWDASGYPLPGQVDLHQLGAGFGGHMWFAHEVGTTDPADTVTATWTPDLDTPATGAGDYRVFVYVPDIGATANAVYTVNENYPRPGGAHSSFPITVDQNNTSGWVDIGAYYLNPGASVSLSNTTDSTGDDLGINAVAFVRLTADSLGKTWVALGDSYSSGEGASPFDPATDLSGINMCHRSAGTYSTDAWTQSDYYGGIALVACSGAVSGDLGLTNTAPTQPTAYADAYQDWTDPAQYAALSSATSLVTMTMGGNDIHFAEIIADCVAKYVEAQASQTTNEDCVNDSVTSKLNPLLTDPTKETAQLEADYVMVHQQAPNAKIVVLTYPDPFPSTPTKECSGVTADDMNWLSDEDSIFTADIIAAVKAEAAAGIPVSYKDESSAFTGHDVCASTPWINTISAANLVPAFVETPWSGDHLLQTFFHPTPDGYWQESQDLNGYLTSQGIY